jgi:hypothetical protein
MFMKYKMRASIVFRIFIVIVILAIIMPALPVFAAPVILISPTSGVAGTSVKVSGSSFSSYINDQLSLYFDDTEIILSRVTISGAGIFQTTFLVPDSTLSGTHLISVRGRTGVVLAESQYYVPIPEIILNRWSGTVGTTIKAFCKGFYAGKEVSVQYYSTNIGELLASQTASDVGECTVQFNIPVSSTGSHKVIARNELGTSAQTDFEVIPSLNINPSVGGVGDRVDISGIGYISNSEVGVTLHGKRVAFAQVSERGSFNAIFYVPVIKAGTYAIEIEDAHRSKKWIDFTVESKITINKPTGEVGLKLTVDGTGFEVGGIVTIKYDAEEISWVMADSDGSFSFSFNVPVSVSGVHFVTVTDGFNTKQAVFTVESDAPPVPKPIVPKRDSMVGAQVPFDWESVYDPSEPIVYTLQIARTDDFLQPIFEKKRLSLSQYVLIEEEALRPSRRFTHYFWRVRATDNASNEGDWSAPVVFQVKPTNVLPEWAKYTLIGIGVLLVILPYYRIRKATAKPKKAEKKT